MERGVLLHHEFIEHEAFHYKIINVTVNIEDKAIQEIKENFKKHNQEGH